MRAVLCAVVALTACGTPNPPEGRQPETAPAAPGGSASAPAAPPDGYQVSVESPAGAVAGQTSIAWVQVHPRAPWHMNVDYPVKLEMVAPAGVTLDAPLLHRTDAEQLDDTALVFPVVFTPRTGHHGMTTLTGELHFAVCGAAECAPLRVPVQFSIDVT